MIDSDRANPKRLRIFSANLLEGRADIGALLELLHSHDVHIAALQEASSSHTHAVAELLPHGRVRLAGEFNVALALKHPAKVTAIRLKGRHAHFARLEPENWPQLSEPLEVLTTHITAPHQWPPWRTFARRRAQVNGLAAHIEASRDHPRVLVGDLNATPRWPAYRRLAGLLDDAAALVARRRDRMPESTWSPRADGRRWLRLDHGLVKQVTVHDFRVLPVPGSDHAGILLEISAD